MVPMEPTLLDVEQFRPVLILVLQNLNKIHQLFEMKLL